MTVEANLPMRSISQEISGKNSVFVVCFCFLFSIVPHFPNLPIWVSGIVLFALSWRCAQNLGRLPELPRWLLIPLVFFGGIGVFAEYWTVVGRDAGLALLTVMTSLKFLESRRHRDMLILVFLCYFLIATHFLFSQTIPTALMMFATLIVITATLIALNQRLEQLAVRDLLVYSSKLVMLSLPLMLILFLLVPRIPGPLWGLSNEQRGGVTGLSDHMAPGKISNLIRSNEVAFRVVFEDDVPAQDQLYWRGPVMVMYNGRRWAQAARRSIDRVTLEASQPAVKYTVTLEPNGELWLLALDVPGRVVEDSVITHDLQLIAKKPINDLVRYSTESYLDYEFGAAEDEKYLEFASRFPADYNPKTIALGKQLADQFDDPIDIVNNVLQMFRQQEFHYTLKPPILGRDSVDEFLFETRRGFCEHYAGSFAMLMRAAGIPARIVTGYQGGEYNEVGNYLIVRQSDAHAWTEVWIEERGWIRVDPTAAVSPNRIESGLDQALADEISSFRIQNRSPLFGNLLYSWDNIQHSWNDWVLNYDSTRQRHFLNKLDIGLDNWSDMVIALVLMLLTVTAGFWGISWWRDRPSPPLPCDRQFNRLLRRLERRGIEKKPSEDARAFLRRINAEDLPERDQLARIVDLYNRIKYGRNGDSQPALRQMQSLIDSFQP